ncbi:trypsin-like peptidase domain-containing protein [Corynebacterium sp. H130]|uniref:trypsin-like peptidase domain-containing protein n=1 Tax=Corynebacterium sp. H130 TaxID=3133444 RepID=UPI003099CA16
MHSAVRLTARNLLASGVLTNAQLIDASLSAHFQQQRCDPVRDRATHVITAAHFAKDIQQARVANATFDGVADSFECIPGTDIAVGRLRTPAPACQLLPIAGSTVKPGQKLVSLGFSDQYRVAPSGLVPRYVSSLVVTGLPWIVTYDFKTRARHGALLLPTGLQWSRRGDSGGPVLRDGQLAGIQSMVSVPMGLPLGFAAINLLGPHLPAIRSAMNQ